MTKWAFRISGVAFLAAGAVIDFPGQWLPFIALLAVGIVLMVDSAIQLGRAIDKERPGPDSQW